MSDVPSSVFMSECNATQAPSLTHSSVASSSLNATAHALAGGSGALIALALVYPLDNLRTRFQVLHRDRKTDTITLLKQILQREGWKGLYSGLRSGLFGVGVSWAVYYYFYAYLKKVFRARGNNSMINLLIAMEAGAISAILTNPIWVVNTRLKLGQEKRDVSFLTAVWHLYKQEGLPGLFRGVGPSLILVMNPAVQFMVYERLKVILQQASRLQNLSSAEYFVLGAISKAVATVVTYPYQVVKSRMQARPEPGVSYAGLMDCTRKIYEHEGIPGFFSGLESKMIATVLTSAFMFVTYERLVEVITQFLKTSTKRRGPL
eukprot:GILK01002084.1.p1 GENE.GILK01002084.1~~GILK01002084.1.p1  ORF type:complete len:319 (-),score=45.80 GILK01002084.1:325-1281(-)